MESKNKSDMLLEESRHTNGLLNATNNRLRRIDKSTRGMRTSLLILVAITVFNFLTSLMFLGAFGR